MKLRSLGNSLRLRISEDEGRQLREVGSIADEIAFGPKTQLRYELTLSKEAAAITATFQSNSIIVSIPSPLAYSWLESSQISLNATQTVDSRQQLSLLIEKDLPCDHSTKKQARTHLKFN